MIKQITVFIVMIAGLSALAQPPGLIDYQGRIAIGDTPYDGVGYFKLAISDDGNTNVWTHNGTNVGISVAPSGCLTNAVTAGIFSLMLGDTTLGMTALTADLFTSDLRYLRVWFSTSTSGPFTEMLPAQRFTSVPYALNTGGLADHTATTNLTLNGHWLSGDGDNEGINIDAAGNVGFGSATANSLVIGGTSTNLSFSLIGAVSVPDRAPVDFLVQGSYMYAVFTEGDHGRFVIFDISSPTAPTEVGSTTNGPTDPTKICVEGDVAYISDYAINSGFYLFDISNRKNPTLVGNSHDGLQHAMSVAVEGNYAYVVERYSSSSMVIFDVSDPTTPTRVGSTPSKEWSKGQMVAVRGNYAYLGLVEGYGLYNRLVTYDVSVPASPVETSNIAIHGATSMVFDDDYAYVTEWYGDRIRAIDLSTPESPVSLSATYCADQPYSICIKGSLALVVSYAASKLSIFDISSRSSPEKLFDIADGINGPSAVQTYGRYVYVANDGSGDISIFESLGIAGLLKADIASVDILEVTQSAIFRGSAVFESDVSIQGNLSVSGVLMGNVGLTVEPSGDLLMGSYTNHPNQ